MNQTLIRIAVVIFAISFSLASCKKDNSETKNSFNYHEKESEIGTVMGFQFGTADGVVYGIGMEFFEKTITVNYVNGLPNSLSGKGDILDISFLTNKLTEIPGGVYNYLDLNTATALKAFTFIGLTESGLYVNADTSGSENPAAIAITGGTVTVSKNGEEYEFTFNLKTNVNSTITGFYKGKPVIYSGGKKKSTSSTSGFFNRFSHINTN